MPTHPSPQVPRPASPSMVRVLAAVALLAACAAGWAQTTLDTLGLTGPVASVEEYREFPGTTDRQRVQTWAFDADGVATERVYFAYSFRDGSLTSRQVSTYEAGRILETVVLDVDDAPIGRTTYAYDARGRLSAQVTLDADGAETRRIEYERDGDGNAVRETWLLDGQPSRTYERDFAADGRIAEERRYDDEGRLVQVETYTVPGQEHGYVQYGDEGEVEATGRVVEGEHGTVLIEVFGPDGAVVESYAWTYDDRGREVERRSVYGEDGDEELLTYAYEDDAQGNWVRQVTTEDLGTGPETYEIRERTIAYR